MGGCWGRCFRGLAAFRLGRSAPSLNDRWSRTVFVERPKRDETPASSRNAPKRRWARSLSERSETKRPPVAERPDAPPGRFVERAKRDETPAASELPKAR